MNIEETKSFIEGRFEADILDTLAAYIRIPNQSKAYDANWQSNGYLDQACELLANWAKKQAIRGMRQTVLKLPGKTPLIFIEIDAQSDKNILLYGHLDKQPQMLPWNKERGPTLPVIENGRLYGRGAADDGYAIFSALTAIEALQKQNIPHGRCVILIEADEESGSGDLPAYIDHLRDRLGEIDLVIGLDSGCGNYEQLWITSSLRGVVTCDLKVEVLTEGVHSGAASGIVPCSFRVARNILNNVENQETGEITLSDLAVEIPAERITQAKQLVEVLGQAIWQDFPFVANMRPAREDLLEQILNKTWRAALSITGADGLPSLATAGNVLRPFTALNLSFRLPPTVSAKSAAQKIETALLQNPPYQAKVTLQLKQAASGWHAPLMQDWLQKAVNKASQDFYQKPAMFWGEGGTIPFIAMLGEKFPKAQFVITGVLGPHSNAHGPNEFLHLDMAKKLTGCVASIIADHFRDCCERTMRSMNSG